MAARRGGKRPGAGRPQGGKSRATKQAKATLSDLARQHTETALNVLVSVAKSGQSESARVAAANAILDRAYGKPSQAHHHSGPTGGPIPTVDLSNLDDAELARLESIFGPLTSAAGSGDGSDPEGEGEA